MPIKAGTPNTAAPDTVHSFIGILTPVYRAVKSIIAVTAALARKFIKSALNGLCVLTAQIKTASAPTDSIAIPPYLINSIVSHPVLIL